MFDWIAPVFQNSWAFYTVILHVAASVSAIIVGTIPMFARKGSKLHNRTGLFYFWAMMLTCASGGLLLLKFFNFFLALITLLSFYAAFSGYRVMYRKFEPAGIIDWLAAAIGLVGGICFAGWGVGSLIGTFTEMPAAFAILGIVFGILLTQDAYKDLVSFLNPPTAKNWWLVYHIERMLGSYIALMTAFSVQTLTQFLNPNWAWTVWAAPGIIGSIVIARWVRIYKTSNSDELAKDPSYV